MAPNDPLFTEQTPFAPNSRTQPPKPVQIIQSGLQQNLWPQHLVSNCSNNYGPYQFPEKLIPLMLVNILHSKSLPIYGDGQNISDWLHVEDHCRAIALILASGKAGETYNVGGENEFSNLRLVKRLCGVIDQRFQSKP